MKSKKVEKMFKLLLPVLQMARTGVEGITYHKWNIYEEIAAIHYNDGHVEAINISANSLSATIKEIVEMAIEGECQGWIKEPPEGLMKVITLEEENEDPDI